MFWETLSYTLVIFAFRASLFVLIPPFNQLMLGFELNLYSSVRYFIYL